MGEREQRMRKWGSGGKDRNSIRKERQRKKGVRRNGRRREKGSFYVCVFGVHLIIQLMGIT